MFSPSLLYDVNAHAHTAISFHTLGMCHVAKNVQGGIPGGIMTTLQMTQLGAHDIGDVDVPRYLLAKDAYGYQVYLCPAATWKDQWNDIMSSGVGSWPAFNATGFNALYRVALALYTDLITRVTLTDDLFLGSHGPYAGVMNIVCKLLLVHGNRVKQIYKVAAPKSFTDPVWNAIDALDVPNISVKRTKDCTTDCPPSLLSYPGWSARMFDLPPDQDSILPNLSRYGVPHLVGEWNNYANVFADWPNQAAYDRRSEPLHWQDEVVEGNTFDEGATERYIFDMWNSLRRGYYARLNDWRVILNGNYSGSMLGVLRDIRNLGL